MKIEIEIGDQSPFAEALAAEIKKSKAAAGTSQDDAYKGGTGFEIKRSDETMALTCVVVSCGVGA